MSSTYVTEAGSTQAEGRWVHTLSQSMLSTFQRCPEQSRAIYFNEVPREDTDSTALGTAVHAAIEWALYEQRDSSALGALDDMIDVAHHELEVIGEWRETGKVSRKQMDVLIARMCGAWFDNVYGTFEPAEIEWKFNLPLYSGKHRDVRLCGTIDCIDTDGLVRDWKTASSPYERWERQRWALQPTVYVWAHNEANPWLDYCTDFEYVVLLHNGDVQQLTVWRDQSHVDWLKQLCSQAAWLIENGVKPWPLIDHGWHCSELWCPKWDLCKGAHMAENWKDAA